MASKLLSWSLIGAAAHAFEPAVEGALNSESLVKITPGPLSTDFAADLRKLLSEDFGVDIWGQEVDSHQPFAIAKVPDPALLERLRAFNVGSLGDLDLLGLRGNMERSFQRPQVSDTESIDDYDYNVYHNLTEIYSWMETMSQSYSARTQLDSIGTTDNGRDIKILKIHPSAGPAEKTVLVDCGIHAREWIAPAFCQYLVNQLMTNTTDQQVVAASQGLNWHVIPVLNPDGYAYTWSDNRMWRKNRAVYGRCNGVDLNRNFDSNWGGPGSSSQCTDTYRGPEVCSEQECQSLVGYVNDLQSGPSPSGSLMYLTFHSYGQYVLFPYGKDFTSVPSNYDELSKLANQAADSAEAVHGKTYIRGQTTETLYPAAGGSDDWCYENGIDLSFTYEMRDTGKAGFQLPPEEIRPACEEVMEAVLVMAEHLRNRD